LPKPPNKAFGRKNNFEQQEEQGSLIADSMAQAAAEGKLDEFLKKELPDNEYARNLASMMMGMTGMMPGMDPTMQQASKQEERRHEPAPSEIGENRTEVPEDVRQAIMGGDMQTLMTLLRREHQKRNPDSPLLQPEERAEPAPSQQQRSPGMPAIDKEIIDALIGIANDNSVTLDWIILRAIKVYVQEYKKTGKL
jgi:hypothetical protein